MREVMGAVDASGQINRKKYENFLEYKELWKDSYPTVVRAFISKLIQYINGAELTPELQREVIKIEQAAVKVNYRILDTIALTFQGISKLENGNGEEYDVIVKDVDGMRTWTNWHGKTMHGKLTRYNPRTKKAEFLRLDSKIFYYPIDQLSESDQLLIEDGIKKGTFKIIGQ